MNQPINESQFFAQVEQQFGETNFTRCVCVNRDQAVKLLESLSFSTGGGLQIGFPLNMRSHVQTGPNGKTAVCIAGHLTADQLVEFALKANQRNIEAERGHAAKDGPSRAATAHFEAAERLQKLLPRKTRASSGSRFLGLKVLLLLAIGLIATGLALEKLQPPEFSRYQWLTPWILAAGGILGSAFCGVCIVRGWAKTIRADSHPNAKPDGKLLRDVLAGNFIIWAGAVVAVWVPDSIPLTIRIGTTVLLSFGGFWFTLLNYNWKSSNAGLWDEFSWRVFVLAVFVILVGLLMIRVDSLHTDLGLGTPMSSNLIYTVLAIAGIAVYGFFCWAAPRSSAQFQSHKSTRLADFPLFWCPVIVPLLILLPWLTGFADSLGYRVLLGVAAVFAAPIIGFLLIVVLGAIGHQFLGRDKDSWRR